MERWSGTGRVFMGIVGAQMVAMDHGSRWVTAKAGSSCCCYASAAAGGAEHWWSKWADEAGAEPWARSIQHACTCSAVQSVLLAGGEEGLCSAASADAAVASPKASVLAVVNKLVFRRLLSLRSMHCMHAYMYVCSTAPATSSSTLHAVLPALWVMVCKNSERERER